MKKMFNINLDDSALTKEKTLHIFAFIDIYGG